MYFVLQTAILVSISIYKRGKQICHFHHCKSHVGARLYMKNTISFLDLSIILLLPTRLHNLLFLIPIETFIWKNIITYQLLDGRRKEKHVLPLDVRIKSCLPWTVPKTILWRQKASQKSSMFRLWIKLNLVWTNVLNVINCIIIVS